jgi:hypothetical protein
MGSVAALLPPAWREVGEVSELRKVKRAAAKAAVSRERLEAAIREAHASGEALRKIAEAAAMSHESVRKIVSR